MGNEIITLVLDPKLRARLDRLVSEGEFRSPADAIAVALENEVRRARRRRLVKEGAKVNRDAERTSAEVGAAADLESWPEY